MNWASSRTYIAASANSVTTSQRALPTGFRRVMHSSPPAIAMTPKIQKNVRVTAYSPFGSDGSHSVDTGCVCAHNRSRSYTNRSREYSEFS